MTNFGKFKPTEVTVDEAEGVAYLLQKAKENRSVAATSMNQNSSRSHSIYSLKI
jgi:kinesin family protein C1